MLFRSSESVLAGELKVVLQDHPLSAFWLSAFYPTALRRSLKLKLFLQGLTAAFSGKPPWDDALIRLGLLPEAIIEQ